MESSHPDLLNDMAEHRSISKNNQTTLTLVFVSHPKKVQHFPQRFLFYCGHFLSVIFCDFIDPFPVQSYRGLSAFETASTISNSNLPR